VSEYDPPKIKHILSAILYTDYDSLSFRFSQTFRKISQNESDEYTKKRGKEFWNWRKNLIQTVNGFGKCIGWSKIAVFYHGVSLIYFDTFYTTFNSPISTTTQLQIAYQFATKQGIILEIAKVPYDTNSKYVQYFNCMFVSCFANEDERLFIQPTDQYKHLHIKSIRNMSTDENYLQYLKAIKFLQRLTDTYYYKRYHGNENYSKECGPRIVEVISILRDGKDLKCPQYVKRLLYNWRQTIKNICLDRIVLRKLPISIEFYESMNEELVRIDILNQIFKEVESIKIINVIKCPSSADFVKMFDSNKWNGMVHLEHH